MKRLIIIVEGDSELEFIKKTLIPYLNTKGVYSISPFKIKHSKGGLNKFDHLQTDIINTLYETDAVITTFIDYYALPVSFPYYQEAQKILNIDERLRILEQSIKEAIELKQNHKVLNLIPYIQLHEFEALCFADFKGFEQNFTEAEANFEAIKQLTSFVNPEEINDGPDTAPSKRLKKLIKGYNKVVYGNIIIETNGIDSIINKCPRFKSWIDTIISYL